MMGFNDESKALDLVRPIPGPIGLPLLGMALNFNRNPLQFLSDMVQRYGDLVKLPIGSQRMYLVNEPRFIKHIFKTRAANFGKANMMYTAMSTLFGNATAIVDGERWKEGFKLIHPSFSLKACERSVEPILGAVDELVSAWGDDTGLAHARDVTGDISKMTLSIIVRQMFGQGVGGQEKQISECFHSLVDFIAYRVLSVVRPPLWWPLPRHVQYRKQLARLNDLMYRFIDERVANRHDGGHEAYRRADANGVSDARGMLADWIDTIQNGQLPGWGWRDLRDEVIGIFVAAHGSTAVFLSWIFYHLATHPDVQNRVQEELKEVCSGNSPSFSDLSRLTYLNQVIQESMRLTPPGWVVSRSAIAEDRFDDYRIPAGAMLLVSPYLIHRHPRYWENPERFDPDRFSPERAIWIRDAENECRYIPFAAGKRACTGRNMAMTEAKLVISRILQRFDLSVPSGHRVVPEGRFTLNLKGGLVLQVKKRRT